MENNILVSIIMPTYNREKEILKTINGVLSQTIRNWELLICDDGSEDNTESVVSQITDSRIHYYKLPHSGLPAVARNWGLDRATGKYIAFDDSDDIWLPDKLEKQICKMLETGLKAAASNSYLVSNLDELEQNKKFFNDSGRTIIHFSDMIFMNPLLNSSVIFEAALLKSIRQLEKMEFRGIEDYIFFLEIALKTSFCRIQDPLLYYYDCPQNSIREERLGKSSLLTAVHKYIVQKYPAETGKYLLKIKIAAVLNFGKDVLKKSAWIRHIIARLH